MWNLDRLDNRDVRGFPPDRRLANQSPLSPLAEEDGEWVGFLPPGPSVGRPARHFASNGSQRPRKEREKSVLWRPSDGLALTSAGLQAPHWDVKGQLQLLSPPCSPPWWWFFSRVLHHHCRPAWWTGGESGDIFSVKASPRQDAHRPGRRRSPSSVALSSLS